MTAPRSRRGRAGRLAGLALMAIGLLLCGYWAADFVLAAWRQHDDGVRWRQLVVAASAAGEAPAALARPADGIDFRLRVPRLAYDAVVREGVGLDVLALGPGHYPGSAWPGQPGTVGVAAHNVFWIQFDRLRPADRLILETRYGTFDYRMTSTRIVAPDDTSVLEPDARRQLTMTTCWPLWAGQFATRRLAIFAAAV